MYNTLPSCTPICPHLFVNLQLLQIYPFPLVCSRLLVYRRLPPIHVFLSTHDCQPTVIHLFTLVYRSTHVFLSTHDCQPITSTSLHSSTGVPMFSCLPMSVSLTTSYCLPMTDKFTRVCQSTHAFCQSTHVYVHTYVCQFFYACPYTHVYQNTHVFLFTNVATLPSSTCLPAAPPRDDCDEGRYAQQEHRQEHIQCRPDRVGDRLDLRQGTCTMVCMSICNTWKDASFFSIIGLCFSF